MTRTIPAIYENGVFRPTQPVGDLPEHSSVRLTIESPTSEARPKRILGLQRDQIIYVAPDFDAEFGDAFWQARCEGLKLVSGDKQIRSYPVDCLWD